MEKMEKLKQMEQTEQTAALFLAADKMCDKFNNSQVQFDYSVTRHEDGCVEINVTEGKSSKKHIDIEFRRRDGEDLYSLVQSRWYVVKSDGLGDRGFEGVAKLYMEGMKAGYTRMVADIVAKELVDMTSLDEAKRVFSEKCHLEIL